MKEIILGVLACLMLVSMVSAGSTESSLQHAPRTIDLVGIGIERPTPNPTSIPIVEVKSGGHGCITQWLYDGTDWYKADLYQESRRINSDCSRNGG